MEDAKIQDIIISLERFKENIKGIPSRLGITKENYVSLPVIVGRTSSMLEKDLLFYKFLIFLLGGCIKNNSIAVSPNETIETRLKELQTTQRLSNIVDAKIYRSKYKETRLVIKITLEMTYLFYNYVCEMVFGSEKAPLHNDLTSYRSDLNNLENKDENVNVVFAFTVISTCVDTDIMSGMLSASSLMESIEIDIRNITNLLGVISSHTIDSILYITPEDIL